MNAKTITLAGAPLNIDTTKIDAGVLAAEKHMLPWQWRDAVTVCVRECRADLLKSTGYHICFIKVELNDSLGEAKDRITVRLHLRIPGSSDENRLYRMTTGFDLMILKASHEWKHMIRETIESGLMKEPTG